MNTNGFAANELLDDFRREVASFNPDYFRWRTKQFRYMNEIVISADQCREFRFASPIKDGRIRCPNEIMFVNAFESRQNVGELSKQLW